MIVFVVFMFEVAHLSDDPAFKNPFQFGLFGASLDSEIDRFGGVPQPSGVADLWSGPTKKHKVKALGIHMAKRLENERKGLSHARRSPRDKYVSRRGEYIHLIPHLRSNFCHYQE